MVLPACAGVIPLHSFDKMDTYRFTRMRGGDPTKFQGVKKWFAFYPHARG